MFRKSHSPLALALACAMLLTCLPAPALAAELEETQLAAVEAASGEGAGASEEETVPEAEEETVAQEEPDSSERTDASVETTWTQATDSMDVAQLIRDNWSGDYFQEAIVDTRRNQVTLDGALADFSEVFDGVTEAEADEILTSTDTVEEYFADTAYETETQSGGKVTVTAPYQTCRVVLTAEDLTEDYGAVTILEYSAYDEYILQFATAEDTQAAYEQLVARYGAENCYVDQIVTADEVLLSDEEDEATTVYSWGTTYMGMDTLKASASSANDTVTVAIIDSGIDPDHEFFQGRTITESSYDFLAGEDEDPTELTDPYGHGTHVAGIIAEATPDNVELMVLRILDGSGSGSLLMARTAMEYALENGADVMNLSLGVTSSTTSSYPTTDTVIQTIYDAGVPICCAAGNYKTDVCYPANNELTIAVSAIGSSGAFASSYSNYGEEIDFCAPGTDIVSAASGGGTISKQGTSMAAAHLTAALTYVITAYPDATVDEMYSILQSCATDLGDEGKDDYYGWGCVTDLANLFTSLEEMDLTITLSQTSYTYDGTAKEPAVTVTDADGGELTQGTDYTVSYSDNTNAGTATVTITGIGRYTGSAETTFQIVNDLSGYTVTLSQTSYTYNGTARKPAVTVKNASGSTLTSGTDYTVSYSNNTNAGTATVTVTGAGNYTGSATATFTIGKANQTVTASVGSSSIYTGKTTTVTGKGTGTITYSSSDTSVAEVSSTGVVTGKKPGTVTITVKAGGNGNYNAASGTVKISVSLSATTISSLTNTSSGITVSWGKVVGASGYKIYRRTGSGSYSLIKTITSGSTVSYSDTAVKSKNGTTYTYAVRAYYGSTQSGYTGKTIARVTGVSISKLKNVKKQKMTVKWKKNSKASGYQIQYSTSSSFSSDSKTVTVSGYKKVSKTISGLTKGKKYYVRVRAYKTVSGTKYYSAWSGTKSVKISK